jgi:ATP-dependent Clp protease protease subunit
MRDTLNQTLSEYARRPIDRIARDVDRDYIMSAEQAVKYGMIDPVVSSRELAPQPAPRRSPDSPVSG